MSSYFYCILGFSFTFLQFRCQPSFPNKCISYYRTHYCYFLFPVISTHLLQFTGVWPLSSYTSIPSDFSFLVSFLCSSLFLPHHLLMFLVYEECPQEKCGINIDSTILFHFFQRPNPFCLLLGVSLVSAYSFVFPKVHNFYVFKVSLIHAILSFLEPVFILFYYSIFQLFWLDLEPIIIRFQFL